MDAYVEEIKALASPFETYARVTEEDTIEANFFKTTPYDPYPALTAKISFRRQSKTDKTEDLLALPQGCLYPVPLRNILLPKLIERELKKYTYLKGDEV